MSLFGEHLIQMCEDKGAEDGHSAAPYSPPVADGYDADATQAYLGNYFEQMWRRPFKEQIEPDRRMVRRVRMIALNRSRRLRNVR